MITNLFNRGDYAEAVRLLVAGIGLWRKLLTGASDLSGKAHALLALSLSYHLLDEMLQQRSKEVAAFLIVNPILANLSMEKKSTNLVWDRHLRKLAWSLSRNRWPPEHREKATMTFLEKFFTKSNATLNDAYDMFRLLAKLSVVEPDEVENEQKDFFQHLGEISKISFRSLYNPLGKKFIAFSFDKGAGVYWNRDIQSLDRLVSRIRGKVENSQGAKQETHAAPLTVVRYMKAILSNPR